MIPIPAFTCPVCKVGYINKPDVDTCSLCKPLRDVCDVCMVVCQDPECNGETYCGEHVNDCVACGTQTCDDHSAQCAKCDSWYCDTCSVLWLDCSLCGDDGCMTCGKTKTCSVCEMPYCKNCIDKCAKCNSEMCRGHTLLLANDTNTYCQNCVDTALNAGANIAACPKSVQAAVNERPMKFFNPPLKLFLYSKAKSMPKPNTTHDWQAEHPIPNSCFIVGTGRKGATVPGAGSYQESVAMCFWVQDDQSQGTEHKWITDYEREFAQYCYNIKQFPSVEQWFQHMEAGWKDMILYFRDYVGPAGANAQEKENLRQGFAGVAAHALRVKLERHYYKTLKIDSKKCYTKIGFGKKTKVTQKKPAAKSIFNGF